MKRIVISLLLIVTFGAVAFAHDCTKIGIKGQVTSIEFVSDYKSFDTKFSETGKLNQLYLDSPSKYIVLSNISAVNGGFVGTWDGIRVTVYTSGGKITKATYSSGGATYTLTYTYNSNGFLATVRQTKSWTERNSVRNAGSARVNTNGYENYMRQAQAALKKGNTAEYQKYLRLAQNAANTANVSVRQSTTTTTTTQKSSNDSQSYTDYETDEYGNWVSRRTGNYRETQRLNYTNEWKDKAKWEKDIQPRANLNKIEQFATSEALSDTYKKTATEEWNRLFMSKYAQKAFSQDDLIAYADKAIMTKENKETVMRPVRENIYSKQVLPERDYVVLDELLQKYESSYVLNQDLRSKITNATQELRADTIASLMTEGEKYMADKSYLNAFRCAREALKANPYCYDAKKLSEEANYQLVLEKEIAKTVSGRDYVDFFVYNPGSRYEQDIKNRRTTFAYSLFNKDTSIEHMEDVVAYGADEETVAPVLKALNKAKFVAAHGSPWRFGVSGGFSFGDKIGNNYKKPVPWNIGLGVRYGYIQKLLNVYAGVEYQLFEMYNKIAEDAPRETLFKVHRLTFPLLLKANLFNIEDGRFLYLSAGANFNLLVGAKYFGTPDKSIAYGSSITPRFSVGLNLTSHLEVELYYSLDKKVLFEPNIPQVTNPKGGYFGMNFRLLFGNSGPWDSK